MAIRLVFVGRHLIIDLLLISLAAISSPLFFTKGALESIKELLRSDKADVFINLIQFGEQYVGIVGIFYFVMFLLVLPHAVIAAFEIELGLVSIVVIVVYIPIFIIAVLVLIVEFSPETLSKLFVLKKILSNELVDEICIGLNVVYNKCCPNANSRRKDLEACITHFTKFNTPTKAHKTASIAIAALMLLAIFSEIMVAKS
ncbi:MAG: hypothetical protein MHMPM18_003958 [Marteilia pararefringens]